MPQLLALLSSALPLQADKARVHLLPAGEFAGVDGRPAPGRKWTLSNAQGAALAQQLTAKHQRVAFQFDYEHQTFLVEKNGQPAPSAGWGRQFEWIDDDGLYLVDVNWTRRAADFIDGDEYRYISPALVYDKTTYEVVGLVNASLVGTPNLYELAPVAQALARLGAEFSFHHQPEIASMNPVLKALLIGLGLPDTATEAEATTALNSLRTQAGKVDGLNTEVATLKSAAPDAAKWVPMERFTAVSGQLATLQAQVATSEVETIIAEAKGAGKVASADVESVWREVGRSNVATLKALVEKTPANPALAGKQQSQGRQVDAGGGRQLTDQEVAICRQMGVSQEDYLKSELVPAA